MGQVHGTPKASLLSVREPAAPTRIMASARGPTPPGLPPDPQKTAGGTPTPSAGSPAAHSTLSPSDLSHRPMILISQPSRGTTLTASSTRSRRCPILHHQLGSCGGSCLVLIMGYHLSAPRQTGPTCSPRPARHGPAALPDPLCDHPPGGHLGGLLGVVRAVLCRGHDLPDAASVERSPASSSTARTAGRSSPPPSSAPSAPDPARIVPVPHTVHRLLREGVPGMLLVVSAERGTR